MMLEKELALARELALNAGKEILEYYAREIIAEEKLGVDNFYEPVTAADRAANRIILDGLRRSFPDDAVLSEEEKDDLELRLSKPRVWIVDPMDGTAGFVKKDGDFGVQIGLAERGEPVLGVVYLPFHDMLYFAVKGDGAFSVSGNKPGKKLKVSDKTDFAEMKLAITRNHSSRNMSVVTGELGLHSQVKRGSVGLKVGLIAEQICDIYIHLSPRTKFWDTCAPQVILEEAGGKLTDIFGFPIEYDGSDVQNLNGVLATNGASHKRAVERLKPLLNRFERYRITAKKPVPGI